jgi:hypothetical protein
MTSHRELMQLLPGNADHCQEMLTQPKSYLPLQPWAELGLCDWTRDLDARNYRLEARIVCELLKIKHSDLDYS